jgi:hypothetical protein
MLAEVLHQFSFTSTDLAIKEIPLTYTAENPPGSQFTFGTFDAPQPPYLLIDEETTVIVSLQGAHFVDDSPISWLSPSSGFTHKLSDDLRSVSIDVTEAPAHYFAPWLLSFNVNVDGAKGVTSPALSLVLSPDQPAAGDLPAAASIDLHYEIDTGIFTLAAAAGTLAHLSILTNSITPFNATFNLFANPTVTFDPTSPVVGPSWPTLLTNSNRNLTISIPDNSDKFTSFRFVLDVGSVRVTSPDPILVNATIGDG